jgi:hypothetical protein
MSKLGWWVLTLVFGWLTYKFATEGGVLMGPDNNKAISFSAVMALAGLYGATNKD